MTAFLVSCQREKEQEEKVREEAQLMEFVRVRQNLRKIHSAIQNKAGHSLSAPEEFTQHVEWTLLLSDFIQHLLLPAVTTMCWKTICLKDVIRIIIE